MSSSVRLSIVGLMLLTVAVLGAFALNMNRPVAQHPVQISQQSAPPPLQTAYLVAAHPLPAGTLARDDDFKSVSATTVPTDAVIDTPDARASLRGSLIRAYLDTGVPITGADVLRPRDRGFIASVLQTGTRAVAIGVDPVSGVAGLIWPGDHVDVILTQDLDKTSAARRTLGETVLTNIRVIAIDQDMVQGASAGINAAVGKLAHTVTVQVDPAQAEKIAVASHLGKLTLSIRAAVDQTDDDTDRTTYGGDVSPGLARTDQPAGHTITVYEGDKQHQVSWPPTATPASTGGPNVSE